MSSKIHATFTSIACVIKATFPGIKDECSACGIILNPEKGVLLSHGSIFTELCLSNEAILRKIQAGQVILSTDLIGNTFNVLLDEYWRPAILSGPQRDGPRRHLVITSQHFKSFTQVKCKFIGAYRNVDFHNALCRIMPEDSWSFASASHDESVSPTGEKRAKVEVDSKDNDNNILFNLLSYCVLLKCDPLIYEGDDSLFHEPLIQRVFSQSPGKKVCCMTGETAEIISTPFGGLNPSVFFNSYSKGIISNVSGTNSCWILTDARCIPGSEGGPLFTIRSDGYRQLSGMIVASLCWKNKEWVGLSLVCGIDSIFNTSSKKILKDALALENPSIKEFDSNLSNVKSCLSQKTVLASVSEREKPAFLPNVVLVKVGQVWGSGVIVDSKSGLILTCSHVIKDFAPPKLPILVKVHGSSRLFKASVIYRQTDKEIYPFDLAVLRCPDVSHCLRTQINMPKIVAPVIGERVWIYGHAVFSSEMDLQPSVSSGVISKVVQVSGRNIMVQSTCAVHAGVSGGPMLNTYGNLVGIVVCNIVDKGSNSSYPHVNFSIPAMTVWPCIQSYIKTGDVSLLKSLTVDDAMVKRVWSLDSTLENEFPVKSKL